MDRSDVTRRFSMYRQNVATPWKSFIGEVPIEFIPAAEPFWTP